MMPCAVFDLQMNNKLEDVLVGIGVNYSYKKFDCDKGIQDLSQPVFVSIILFQFHSLCEL